MIDLRLGDCIEILKTLPDNSVDSVVVDPPYHLTSIVKRFGKEGSAPAQFGTDGAFARASKGFMGKEWDGGDIAFRTDVWSECLRVLKPGGYLLSFSAPRTYHRMAVAIEDAGFEIRDQIMWIYGSGFPKSHNIGKSIQKLSGDIKVVGKKTGMGTTGNSYVSNNEEYIGGDKGVYKKEYDDIEINNNYEGYGTALKPAHEPICMARKPLSEKSIAENVLRWGTGGINIDGSRIGTTDKLQVLHNEGNKNIFDNSRKEPVSTGKQIEFVDSGLGRFPANIMFECICDELIDGKEIKGNENYNWNNTDTESNTFTNRGTYTPRTETPKIHTNPNCPCYILDEQSGIKKSIKRGEKYNKEYDNTNTATKLTPGKTEYTDGNTYADKGGASRFFYSAKVSKKERNAGLDGFEKKSSAWMSPDSRTNKENYDRTSPGMERFKPQPRENNHPTVKPIAVMEYLIKMVTPKGGTTLDCFMGSGSTGIAAKNLGMNFIGIEKEQEYMDIAKQRINYED